MSKPVVRSEPVFNDLLSEIVSLNALIIAGGCQVRLETCASGRGVFIQLFCLLINIG